MRATTRSERPEIVTTSTTEGEPVAAATHVRLPTQNPERESAEPLDGAPSTTTTTEADRHDRRRFAAQTRHSWAAQRPYDLRTGGGLEARVSDPVARAQQRRAEWVRPL